MMSQLPPWSAPPPLDGGRKSWLRSRDPRLNQVLCLAVGQLAPSGSELMLRSMIQRLEHVEGTGNALILVAVAISGDLDQVGCRQVFEFK